MNHVCPSCGTALPEKLRDAFCPVCTLQTALHGAPPTHEYDQAIQLVGRIGDYELIREIARGGVGVVYAARQVSLGRVVALKLLLAGHFADPIARQRFRAEAEAAARLRHPNVVTIHEVGEHEGQPFLAMQYMEGGTLTDLVRDQPLAARPAAVHGAKIARAIAHAHAQGIIHRDLKPSNILLDADGEPRITDFGLAKLSGMESDLTLTGQVLGSPAFMAPEQAVARPGTGGPGTDLYAIGAILYQLVTTRPPFQGDSAAAVLRHVQEADAVPVRRLNPGVPLDLETVIHKCLEKEPARRYASASDLADDLERFVRGEPVRVRPLSGIERGWRWCRRHPVRAGGLAVVLLLLVAVATVSTVAAVRIRQAERAATSNLQQALLSEANAVRLGGQVGQRTRSLDALRALPRAGLAEDMRLRARNEAIATLALDDIRFVPQPLLPALEHASRGGFSRDYSRYGHLEDQDTLVISAVNDGTELRRLALGTNSLGFFGGFGPDQRYVRLYGQRQASVWDLENGQEIFRTEGSMTTLDFHPTRPLLAAAGSNGIIRFIELPSGEEKERWPRPDGAPPRAGWSTLQFSPDGATLAAAYARTGLVDLIQFDNRQLIARWETGQPVSRLRWTHRGDYIALGLADGSITVWDTRLHTRSWRFAEVTPGVRDFAWSRHGNLLAVTCVDHNVWVWDSPAARLVFKIPCNADEVEFAEDNRRLGPVWRDGVTGWLETVRSEEFREWVSGTTETTLQRVSFSPDGRVVLTRSPRLVRVHSTQDPNQAANLFAGTIYDAQFEPGRHDVWILHAGGLVRRRAAWQENTGEMEKSPRDDVLPGSGWRGMSLATDRPGIALLRTDQSVWQLNRDTLELGPLLGPTNRTRFVGLSPNGRWLATLNTAQQLSVHDVASGSQLMSCPAPAVARVVFSPDNRWLATFDPAVDLIETGAWRKARTVSLPAGRPAGRALTFTPDSQSLLVTSDWAEIHQIDLTTGRHLATFQAPSRIRVHHLEISPDGRTLATACDFGRFQLWDRQRLQAALRELQLE